MSDKLLTEGNTAASIDELYLFLTNLTAIEYIRNFMKRADQKESAVEEIKIRISKLGRLQHRWYQRDD